MGNRINIIVKELERFKESYKYDWPVKNALKTLESIDNSLVFDNNLMNYEIDILLKEKIREKLIEYKSTDLGKFDSLSKWIIKDWGNISLGKLEDSDGKKGTDSLIKEAFEKADKKEIDFKFDRISSISKVLSFYKPEIYAIYDSRVVYTLNWLLLKAGEDNQFFPVPDGRNSKMMAFDINVLIRLKNIKEYQSTNMADISKKLFISQIDKKFYIEKNKAYANYVKLIRELNVRLFPDKANELFHTEMLLFSIADKQIYKDITDSISIKIN